MDHFSTHSSGDERVPVYQLRPRFHIVIGAQETH